MQLKFLITFLSFTFALVTFGYAAENQENTEVLYSQAITFRNKRTPETTLQAKDLFWRIGHLECPEKNKALHNYAVILYSEKNCEDAYKYFQQAGLPQSLENCTKILQAGHLKEDLYLVVGSDRGKTIEGSDSHKNITHIVHGRTTNVSHASTFEGKATTMDLRSSKLCDAKHIVGDVSSFNFKQRYNVKHVLLERLPTVSQETFTSDFSLKKDTENYIGMCIQQTSEAMKSGAILEIEWDPFLTSVDSKEILGSTVLNPFNGFIDLRDIFQAVKFLHANRATEAIIAKELREQMTFFHQQGLGDSLNQLIEKTFQEVQILENMFRRHLPVCIKCDLETCSIQKFIEEGPKATYSTSTQRNEEVKSYDVATFISRTFLNFFMAHRAAKNNSSFVISYLESIGFKDVSIERRQNPHNGRNNVWMVYAVKS
jgi:hypothetical protein